MKKHSNIITTIQRMSWVKKITSLRAKPPKKHLLSTKTPSHTHTRLTLSKGDICELRNEGDDVFIGEKKLRIRLSCFCMFVYNWTLDVLLLNDFRVAGQTFSVPCLNFEDMVKIERSVVHTRTFFTRVWLKNLAKS